MENVKDAISKKKTMNHILCYFGLVVLTILLFVPLVIKIVFKDRGETKEKEVVTMLVCDKEGEKIESSFLNEKAKSVKYTIVGDYTNSINNQNVETTPTPNPSIAPTTTQQPGEVVTEVEQINPVMKLLLNYGSIEYDDAINKSSIRFSVEEIVSSKDYELIFDTIVHQEEYYNAQGFVCTKNTL